MSWKHELRSMLPALSRFNIRSLSHPVTYIGAAGFEDRAMSILDSAISENVGLESAIAIEYRPFNPNNRVSEFRDRLAKVGAQTTWLTFDRYDPQRFSKAILPAVESLSSGQILVDISAMSKFLIMVLLQALRDRPNSLTMAYTEAEIYHPTRKEFEIKKQELGAAPDFLTTDVYKILTVTSLSTVSMQGYPILLLAFPTFNRSEIVALYNELAPKHLILLEGEPHEERDKWRLDAIREVNKEITNNPDYSCEPKVLSTFDYMSNVEALEEIYQKYWYTHKILLAPTGSKLQTIAAFMFRQLHPDVQVVYPVTKAFIGEYSEKCRALWSIHLTKFSDFIASLDGYRKHV
jgi:hypothetical protein